MVCLELEQLILGVFNLYQTPVLSIRFMRIDRCTTGLTFKSNMDKIIALDIPKIPFAFKFEDVWEYYHKIGG